MLSLDQTLKFRHPNICCRDRQKTYIKQVSHTSLSHHWYQQLWQLSTRPSSLCVLWFLPGSVSGSYPVVLSPCLCISDYAPWKILPVINVGIGWCHCACSVIKIGQGWLWIQATPSHEWVPGFGTRWRPSYTLDSCTLSSCEVVGLQLLGSEVKMKAHLPIVGQPFQDWPQQDRD